MQHRFIAVDIESIGLTLHNGVIWIISYGKKLIHDCKGIKGLPADLSKILADKSICKIIHSSEFDAPYLEMNGGAPRIKNIWDTRLCEIVIHGFQLPRKSTKELTQEQIKLYEKYSSSLEYTLPRYGFPKPDKSIRKQFINRPIGQPFSTELIKYAGDDTKYLPALQKAQEYILTRDGLLEVALLENKVAERVAQMRVVGLGIDERKWMRIADENLTAYNKIISNLPREVSNWNSPAQVKKFFGYRGVIIDSLTNIEKIQRTANDRVLKQFIEARNMYSDATAYGEKWLRRADGTSTVDPDGRIRCSWEQILNTGRFASSNPNILALPKAGRQRSAIVPRKGYVFIIGDYTGQEIGVMAAAAKEKLWIDTLLRGDDIHGLTASIIFPLEWQRGFEKGCTFPKKCNCKEHKRLREHGKVANLAPAYGGGADSFSERTGHSVKDARKLLYKFQRSTPALTRYLRNNANQAIKTGVSFSADPYRRRRVLNGNEDWQIANQGKNNPIQSASANMLKLAMISIPEKYDIVLPFHDELVLEVPRREGEAAKKTLKKVMEDSSAYITGIAGLIKIDPRISNDFSKQ